LLTTARIQARPFTSITPTKFPEKFSWDDVTRNNVS